MYDVVAVGGKELRENNIENGLNVNLARLRGIFCEIG